MIPIVSYYTIGTPYEQEALEMEQSARDVGLRNILVIPVENRGSWEANCQAKPQVLLQAVAALQRHPFFYVDADARFMKMPILSGYLGSKDFGAHYFRGKELLSGTLWVNPTTRTIMLLSDWAIENRKNPKAWDQKVLQTVLERRAGLIEFINLPPEYTWIHDLSARYYGYKSIDPIICHYQASRKYKRRV